MMGKRYKLGHRNVDFEVMNWQMTRNYNPRIPQCEPVPHSGSLLDVLAYHSNITWR